MANAVSQRTPPSSPGSSAMSSSSDAPTPGGAGGAGGASGEELFGLAFPQDHGWVINGENGRKKARRVVKKISDVLKGPHGSLTLNPNRVLAVLRHADCVPVEHPATGWLQGEFYNHKIWGGYTLACQLEDKRLSDYLDAAGIAAAKTQEEVRQRRVTFYEGLFEFEEWLFSKCKKPSLKCGNHPKFNRGHRWAYIAKKCGFKPSSEEEFVVDEDGVVVID